jgi:hypothetical protein
MTTKTMHTSAILRMMALLFLTNPWAMAGFVPPTEQAPFRRDQVPIDLETMSQLSRQLTALCSSLKPTDPSHPRVAAQLLAMARALDPMNRNVELLGDAFTFEKQPGAVSKPELDDAMNDAWQTQAWLSSKEAGRDGQLLANCLGDVLAKFNTERHEAAAFKTEMGQWNGWVAPATEFAKANSTRPEIRQPNAETIPKEETKLELTPSGEIDFALQSASVQCPLWLFNEEKKAYSLKVATVTMKASTGKEGEPFHYHLENVSEERIKPILLGINQNTAPFLNHRYKGLPKNGVIGLNIEGVEVYSSIRNNANISAAAAVLASASLSGEEPVGIVMGIIDKNEKLILPLNSWELIALLDSVPPSRIVLPKAAAELLPSLLALDNLSFFMKHDILFAENLDELIRFSKKSPDPAVAEALANFAGIRQKATNTLGPFVTNPFVSKRLEALASALPQYASVQCLLMQAKGQRPRLLNDKIVAHEIRRAMLPLQPITATHEKWSLADLNTAQIQAAHLESRKILDPMEKLVSAKAKTQYNTALNLSNTARTLARASKKIHERGFGYGYVEGYHDKLARESIALLRNDLRVLNQDIAISLGEAKPVPKPDSK